MRKAATRCTALLAAAVIALAAAPAVASAYAPPPADAGFDYQIGGDYALPDGVSVVSRDWFSGRAAPDPAYTVCYVNAFQTQADERGVNRPDERSSWPRGLVLARLGDDPHWGGEYLIDISTKKKRARAAAWVEQMVDGCADRGFDGVEFDNLDSWTRFNGTPLKRKVPFGRADALAYAKLLARDSHERDLAVGQKNAAGITTRESGRVGFDFAVAEECGRYRECNRYTKVHGDHVIAIEYRRKDFRRTCEAVGDRISVVLRDRQVSRPGGDRYVYDSC